MLKNPQFSKEMGKYFQALRKKAGLSQSEVSSKLGYKTAQFVSNWERGIATPPVDKLKDLIELYGGNPQEVFKLILNYQEQLLKDAIFGGPQQHQAIYKAE